MINSFFSSLYALVLYRENLISNLFKENNKFYLSFALLLIVLKAVCEYLSLLLITNIGEFFPFLTLFSFGMFFVIFIVILVFLKSAIIAFFRKGNEESEIENHKIYVLFACSYFPFLFLPSALILFKGLFILLSDNMFWQAPLVEDFFFPVALFIYVGVYIWTAVLRVRFFANFSNNFYTQPVLLVIIPKMIEIGFIFVILMLISFSSAGVIAYIQKLIANMLNSGINI